MTPAERILKVQDFTGLGPVALALKVGLSKTRITDIVRTKAKKIPYDVATSINKNFPTISLDWLLEDTGSMILENEQTCACDEQQQEIAEETREEIFTREFLATVHLMQQQIEEQTQLIRTMSALVNELTAVLHHEQASGHPGHATAMACEPSVNKE